MSEPSSKTTPERLLKALVKGGTLQQLMNLAAEIMENPVLISAVNETRFFASDLYEIKDPSALQALESNYVDETYKEAFEQQNFRQKMSASDLPLIFEGNFQGGFRRIVGKAVYGQYLLGYVFILETNRPFREDDIQNASLICDVLALKIYQKNKYLIDVRMYNWQLRSLLSDRPCSARALAAWADSVGWGTRSHFVVYVMSVSAADADCFPSMELQFFLHTERISNTEFITLDNDIIMLSNPVDAAERHIVSDLFRYTAAQYRVAVGMSPSFTDLNDFSVNYHRAKGASEIGWHLHRKPDLYRFDQYRMETLVYTIYRHGGASSLFTESLKQLKAHDRQNQTDYYKTLEAYIRANGRLSAAADNLHIHRNTLVYRLEKITDLIGENLADENIRCLLFLSFRAERMKLEA